MTPTETTTILRQFNEWRRGDEDIPQFDPREIGAAIDAAVEMIERLELAESVLKDFGTTAQEVECWLERYRRIEREAEALRARIEAMELECDAMRTMIQVALEVLDNVRGNINPERGYADELEVDIKHAITTITSLAQRKTP